MDAARIYTPGMVVKVIPKKHPESDGEIVEFTDDGDQYMANVEEWLRVKINKVYCLVLDIPPENIKIIPVV